MLSELHDDVAPVSVTSLHWRTFGTVAWYVTVSKHIRINNEAASSPCVVRSAPKDLLPCRGW